MKMGDKAIVEVETISSGSLGIDLALGVGGYPRGRIIEILVQNHLENNLNFTRYCRSSKAGGIAALLMQNTLLIELCREIRCRYRKPNHFATR
jgi:recombination protein RecA